MCSLHMHLKRMCSVHRRWRCAAADFFFLFFSPGRSPVFAILAQANPWPSLGALSIWGRSSVCLRFFIFHYFFPLFFVLDCDFWAHCEHFESGGGARRASGCAPFFFPPVCRGRVVLFFLICFWGHCESGGWECRGSCRQRSTSDRALSKSSTS